MTQHLHLQGNSSSIWVESFKSVYPDCNVNTLGSDKKISVSLYMFFCKEYLYFYIGRRICKLY